MDSPLIALFTNNDDDVFCFRLELIQAVLQNGYRMLISCPDGSKFELMEELGLRKNVEFIYDNPPIDRRGTNVVKDSRLLKHYYQLLKKYNPSVVLAYTAKPNVYASIVANMLHIPVINNVTGLGSIINENGIKKKMIMLLFKWAYQKSSCIMFQNSANMELAKQQGWIRGDSRLIPGSGVALTRYPIQDYPNCQEEKVVFNYIGRIMHDKGVDDYIEVACRIKKKYPMTEFNMIGFIEPTEKHYEALLEELEMKNIVLYRGAQKDVRPWIRRAHAIIHPSTYGEGISNVLLENASSGRPIITTDNPGCRETVDENISGFIYQGGNVNALEEKVEKFINMNNYDRMQMGLRGRKKVEKEFSREIVIAEYLKKIKEIIGDMYEL